MIDDRFDRLASLFLGDLDPTPTAGMEAAITRAASGAGSSRMPATDSGGAGTVVITPLVPGNLPVLAHPWLWHVAARLDARPSALIRVASDGVQVAMLNTTGPAESAWEDLGTWMVQAATVARRWFVVPRSGGEVDTVSALHADEAVVVSGADEAATVAAYQWVRRLVESAKGAGRSAPLTPIAIVGCEEQAAKDAAATVSTASQAFLQQPVPLAGAFPRLERTAVSEQRFYGDVVQPAELLALIRTACATAWAKGRAATTTPAVAPAPMTPPPATPGTRVPEPVEATPSVAASQPAPVEVPAVAPMVPAAAPDSIVASIPGLWPLAIPCPGHSEVEFATDDAGRLHVLVMLEHAASLRPARAWAQRHAALLRTMYPGLAADPLPIVERLAFTDATRAVEWHHTGVRLDLLVRTPAGRMHVPLNDERSMLP